MEDLNKHQLILLTLLVSFVTSIATGIITFTLLQEAPVAVTQNINRVVERTIEKVVPAEGGGEVIREVEVVKEEELVLQSIDKVSQSLVRIKTLGADGSYKTIGLGLVVSNGIIVGDERSLIPGANYNLVFADGKSYGSAGTYLKDGLVFFKVGKPVNEKYTYYPAVIGNSDSLKLGQSVIAIAGKESNSVTVGRIAHKDTSEAGVLIKVETDIPSSKTQLGSPLVDLNGQVVGLESVLLEGDRELSYIPSSIITSALKIASQELSK